MRLSAKVLIAALAFFEQAAAHPGHDINSEIAERSAGLAQFSKRDLSHCVAKNKARGLEQRSIQRRTKILQAERAKRGLAQGLPKLRVRDAGTVLNTTHLSPIDYSPLTPLDVIFESNSSCVLSPETTEGPYFVSGEYIRTDLRETQAGVDLILDLQVLDITTCDPVENVWIDFWHCNSTGVYGGVIAGGNGNINDLSNINATFLRGLQQTKEGGVAQFTTTFPGHYTGRAPHIHVATHINGTVNPNNTFSGTTVSHVGQVFFDQSLITQVELAEPYVSNTQRLTTNTQDGIFNQEAAIGDPVIEYSLIGETIEQGIFGWISFGVNVSHVSNMRAAVTLTQGGGVANNNTGGGGPGGPGGPPGGPPPNGTIPLRH